MRGEDSEGEEEREDEERELDAGDAPVVGWEVREPAAMCDGPQGVRSLGRAAGSGGEERGEKLSRETETESGRRRERTTATSETALMRETEPPVA